MQTLEKHDIRDPEISKKIAVKLYEFHGLDMPYAVGERKAKLWERLRLAFPYKNSGSEYSSIVLQYLYQHLL